jgi:hypothetical protein
MGIQAGRADYGLLAVCLGLQVLIALSAFGDDHRDAIARRALDVERVLALFDAGDGVLLT